MRNFAIASLVLVSLLGTSAYAADLSVTAPIKALDSKACSVTLDNGSAVYNFGKTCNLAGFKVGEKVTITYLMNGKAYDAKSIKAA